MEQTAIETKNLCKSYFLDKIEIPVLKNIDLEIKKGEFVSVMGPSGSGKSTLLYIMGGLENSTKGKVLINGIQMANLSDQEQSKMRRRAIGFVFQSYNLVPNLTAEENILLPLQLDGRKKKDCMEQLDQILSLVGLQGHRKHTPRELSGGQQQRVSIARALITNPGIIFADEPIGNLDSKTGTEIMELLRDINKSTGTTIIMVTHAKESTEYGTRIIRLKDGEVSE